MELEKRSIEHKGNLVTIELTCQSSDDARELFQAMLDKMERGEALVIRATSPTK